MYSSPFGPCKILFSNDVGEHRTENEDMQKEKWYRHSISNVEGFKFNVTRLLRIVLIVLTDWKGREMGRNILKFGLAIDTWSLFSHSMAHIWSHRTWAPLTRRSTVFAADSSAHADVNLPLEGRPRVKYVNTRRPLASVRSLLSGRPDLGRCHDFAWRASARLDCWPAHYTCRS